MVIGYFIKTWGFHRYGWKIQLLHIPQKYDLLIHKRMNKTQIGYDQFLDILVLTYHHQ